MVRFEPRHRVSQQQTQAARRQEHFGRALIFTVFDSYRGACHAYDDVSATLLVRLATVVVARGSECCCAVPMQLLCVAHGSGQAIVRALALHFLSHLTSWLRTMAASVPLQQDEQSCPNFSRAVARKVNLTAIIQGFIFTFQHFGNPDCLPRAFLV